jgi:hypothetical protein
MLPYLLPLPVLLLSRTTASQLLVWECGLHILWKHSYVLCSPPTVLQELSNYTYHFLHCQSVVSALLLLLTWSLGKTTIFKTVLDSTSWGWVTSYQSSAVKCIADSTSSIVYAASWSSLFSDTVTAFGMPCFLSFYLNEWMIPKSKDSTWWIELIGKTELLFSWEMFF